MMVKAGRRRVDGIEVGTVGAAVRAGFEVRFLTEDLKENQISKINIKLYTF